MARIQAHLPLRLATGGALQLTGQRAALQATAGEPSAVDLPKDLGEFVIVHELVHLLAPNHGPVFKSFLYAYLPDWETRACQLHAYTGLR